MKKLLILIYLLNIQSSFSQKLFWEITGKVVDEKQKPVEFANVFANNTSFRTTTDSNGSFKLHIPNTVPNIELVVSFVGFQGLRENITQQLGTEKIYSFSLKPIAIPEVTITAKRPKDFKRKWQLFQAALLGQSDFARECKILNPDVIRLQYDDEKNLFASAVEPIYIQNDALGYKITLQMSYFKCNGSQSESVIDQFFEKLLPRDTEQEFIWNKNRKIAFKRSFRNFLVSVANNRLKNDKLEVFQTNFKEKIYTVNISVYEEIVKKNIIPCKLSDFYFYDKIKDEHNLFTNKQLLVFLKEREEEVPIFSDYPYKNAMVILPQNTLTFSKGGWLLKPNGVILTGFWANEGLSVSLPADFVIE
ncbi:hypothetical protein GOQ04_18275 [Emticicia sp. ODNR4P]|nr:hypothetical protein [Emticicia sp. ODNR4P]